MDALNQYSSKWGLSDASLIAETPTSHVYRVQQNDASVILKLLTPIQFTGRYHYQIDLIMVEATCVTFQRFCPPITFQGK
ncbi:MAG: hypothetical protein KDD58_12900 [Bdellovibrionales bacterium]|nr:hypothetical protein [Bdellovibrionales bacterium]